MTDLPPYDAPSMVVESVVVESVVAESVEAVEPGRAATVPQVAGEQVPPWRSSLTFALVAWLVGVLGYVVVTSMSCLTFDAIRDPLPSLDRVLHSWERCAALGHHLV